MPGEDAPLEVSAPRLQAAPVSAGLLAVNLALCLVPWGCHRLGACGLADPDAYSAWLLRWALRPEVAFGEWWRLVTSGFVHAPLLAPVDALHIGMNAVFLGLLGPILERQLGAGRFLAGYLLCLLGGCLLSLGCGDELPGSLGASGALFGLIGILCGLVLPHRDALDRELYRAYAAFFAVFFALTLVSAALLEPLAGVQFAHAGHLGGLAVGAVLGAAYAPRLLGLRRKPAPRWLLVACVLVALVGVASLRVARYHRVFDERPRNFEDFWRVEETPAPTGGTDAER